jgi:CBS domain containing-hemolysin-like protein
MSISTVAISARLFAGLLFILTNGFFVAIEFALTRARQFTEDEFVDGDARLERAWEMTQELGLYLTTCQVGITASSIAVGIVYAPSVLHNLDTLETGEKTLEELSTPPLTVASDTSVSDFIDQCQAENQELALVLDDGNVVGLVTATDAFEEVLGELEDPMDREL